MEMMHEIPEANAEHSSKIGKAPIPRLLLGMAWPIILSMAVQAVYNIMDSVFSARIPGQREAALSALGLPIPSRC